jgi:hypothetical protein
MMLRIILLSFAISTALVITGGESLEEFLRYCLALVEAFFSPELSFDVNEVIN